MRVLLDMPVRLFRPDEPGHAETRAFYLALQQALLEQGATVELSRAPAPEASGPPPEAPPGALRYAYHAQACGARTRTIKASALPGLWHIDPQGYSGWSRLATDPALQARSATFDEARARAAIALWRGRFLERNLSKYAQPDAGEIPEPGFLFYPLQVNGDRVLGFLPLAQTEILAELARLADGPARRVVIKRHPLCDSAAVARALDGLAGHPWITVSAASVHRLIPAARAVLVANSGVGLEALIHGRPVLAMAASEYRHMATPLDPRTELPRALAPTAPPDARSIRQLGWLLDEELLSPDRPQALAARIAADLAAAGHDGTLAEDTRRTHAVAAFRETLRRHLEDSVTLLLDLPPSAEGEQNLLRALRFDIQREAILRRAGAGVLTRGAAMFLRQGAADWAARCAEAALARDPQAGSAHLVLARLAFQRKDKAAGLAALRRAVDCPDAPAAAHLMMARRLRDKGPEGLAQARAHLKAALAADPQSGLAWLTAGEVALAAGDRPQAAACLAEGARLLPDHPATAALRAALEAAPNRQ